MSSRRVHLFGIGSAAWMRDTGHKVSKLGVPIPSHGPSRRLLRAFDPFKPKPRRRRRR